MATIPLVALNAKTPEQPDMLQKYGQLLALKNAQQQQALMQQEAPLRLHALQQQTQLGGLQVQKEQQALKDNQALTAAMDGWDGRDYNDLIPLVHKNGGSAQAIFGLKKTILEQQQAASTTLRNNAEAGKAQVEATQKKNDMLVGALAPLVDASQVPDAQLPQTLAATVQDLQQKGLLDPQHAQAATQLVQSGDPQQIRQGIDRFRKTFMAQSQIMEQAKNDATIANQKAEREQAAANAAETARHNRRDEALSAGRLSSENARLAFDIQRQGTQDQQAIENQAQQIANYDVKGLSQARNNPYSRAVMQRVYEINQQYSDQGYTTKQDFLSSKGKANAQVQSLNKLSAHLQELQSASDKAGFSPVGFTSAGKDLRLAEQLFSKEDVKFLSGSGVGTEGELNGLIDKTHSPIQSVRDSAINTLSKFTADAARQLGDQWERGTKMKFDPNQHFTPTTVQMMQKNGGTSARENTAPKAAAGPPPGATHIVPGSDGKMHYTDGKNDLGVVQ